MRLMTHGLGCMIAQLLSGAFDLTHVYQSNAGYVSYGGQNVETISFDSARVTRTAEETRPVNVALLACIKS